MSSQFKKLLEPVTIGTMKLKNRVVMCPMCSGHANAGGDISERIIDYYGERAKGGVGLVIVEGATIDRHFGNSRRLPRIFIDSDLYIAGLHRLAERIHLAGAKAALQLQHHGRWSYPQEPGVQAVAPSAGPGQIPEGARALNKEEIWGIQDGYARAAARAKQAGFDALSINGGGAALVHQFLSPLYNQRTDGYGGSLDNRMRFVIELIQRVQQQVGAGYPIIFDHPVAELKEGGITLEEGKIIARRLERLGIAAFRIHPHNFTDPIHFASHIPPAAIPHGPQVQLAQEFKEVLDRARVIVGRRINEPVLANRILEEGKADLIALGRPLIADPAFVNKVAEGRAEDIRRCLACNHCWWCYSNLLPVTCTVNPASGKERLFKIVPAPVPKKVLIIGGGPGGMEAARVARLRGHDVTLYEKEERLGGTLNLASVPPHKEEIVHLLQYYENQLKKTGVKVALGKKVTGDFIAGEKPDLIIGATGARPLVPGIPGVERSHVFTYEDVLTGNVPVGERVAVVGGGTVGCELAEYLAGQDKKVAIIEQLAAVGTELDNLTRALQMDRLNRYRVRILTNTRVGGITAGEVLLKGKDGTSNRLPVDTVVIACGLVADNTLFKDEMPARVCLIGDCLAPRTMLEAIQEGRWAANLI